MNKKDDLIYIDLNDEPKANNKKMTFTKKMVSVILFVSLLDVQFVFLLALLGKMQIAETLGVAIVTELIATILGYLCKSFFENREIGKNEIENKKIEYDYSEMVNASKELTQSIQDAQFVNFGDEDAVG